MYFKKLILKICAGLVNFVLNQCKKIFSPITTNQLVRAAHCGGNLEQWLSLGASPDARDYNGLSLFYNTVHDLATRIAEISDLHWINKKFNNIDALIRYRANLCLHDVGIELLHAIPNFMRFAGNRQLDDQQFNAMFCLFSSWQLAIIRAGVDINAMRENSTALFKHLTVGGDIVDRRLLGEIEKASIRLIRANADVNVICDENIAIPPAQPNIISSTALHVACKSRVLSVNLITELVNAGANLNTVDDFGWNPYHHLVVVEERWPRLEPAELFYVTSLFLRQGASLRESKYSSAITARGGVCHLFAFRDDLPKTYNLTSISDRVLGFLWGDSPLTRQIVQRVYKFFDEPSRTARLGSGHRFLI